VTSKTKLIVFTSLISILCLLFFVLNSSNETSTPIKKIATPLTHTDGKSPHEETHPVVSTSASIETENLNDDSISESGEGEEEQILLWNISDIIIENALPFSPVIHNPETIELNPNWASEFEEFDEIILPLPHKKVAVIVETKSVFPNGDISWSGHLSGFGDQYPVLITIGKNISFGTITTPEGEYTVEIKGTTGTVYKTPRVDELSSDDSPDFLIPDEDT